MGGDIYYISIPLIMKLSFIQSTAALSVFVWMSLAIVGGDKVYHGNKEGKS
jgi:hypothetical protein